MPIVGTAGHVDHGKSALVTALTGTDPDRLLEERVRGMTLDLGFARLQLNNGLEAGVVDVPGHERFLHNMLAGAAGMELALLVVAADEGVMPQTREHLAILGLLGVRATIVVVSKIDLIAVPERAACISNVVEALRGTPADGAPVVAVSSRSGEGLGQLRAAIAMELRRLPPRDALAPVYLPVDRVFSLPGRGTIVTGTLVQGRLREGDALLLEPGAKRVRARTIQSFGQSQTEVRAGSRVAVNLAGIARQEVVRGQTIVGGQQTARGDWRVRFVAVPEGLPLLRRRTPVRIHLGAAELFGTLVFQAAPTTAAETPARLHLREPAAAFGGLRFVVRALSPKALLGGGTIEGVGESDVRQGRSAARDAVLAVLRARGIRPGEPAEVAREANLRESLAQATLTALAARDLTFELRRPLAFADAASAADLLSDVTDWMQASQAEEPWSLGLTSLALARRLNFDEPLLVRYLQAFAAAGRIATRGGYYATLDHRPQLSRPQREFVARLLDSGEAVPLRPQNYPDVLSAIRHCGIVGMARAFDTMLASGELVKVGSDLYRHEQITAVRALVKAHFDRHDRMTASQFRDAIGTSRKYAVPLLEWLDAAGVTVRDGDYRRPRGDAERPAAGSAAVLSGKAQL